MEGKSEKPVYMWIHGERNVDFLGADELLGLDTFATQKRIRKKHGADTATIAIGPAREKLVRSAVILTETGNASGQGGFGAVMGSKKLKAIAVTAKRNEMRRIGRIKVADPKRLMKLWKLCEKLLQGGQRVPEVPSSFMGIKVYEEIPWLQSSLSGTMWNGKRLWFILLARSAN